MKDPNVEYAKELKDMGLVNLNKWPGYFMRRFKLTYAQAELLADQMARYVEVGKYAPVKRPRPKEFQ